MHVRIAVAFATYLLASAAQAQPVTPPPTEPPPAPNPPPPAQAPTPAPTPPPTPAPTPAPTAAPTLPPLPPATAAPTPAPTPAPTAAPVAPSLPPVIPPSSSPLSPDDALGPSPEASLSEVREEITDVPRAPGAEALPSMFGPAGLLRLSTAEVGVPGQFRFGLSGEYFSAADFLIDGDRNLRLAGALALGYTPLRFLEIFGAVTGSANRNRRICASTAAGTVCNSEPGRNDPEVIKAYGDVVLGTKFAYPLSGGVSAGGELGLRFYSSVSGISIDPSATSVWLTGLTSWDLRAGSNVPLRLHLNLGLFFDNSAEVQDYRGISRPSKAVSQFAYGIAKDRVRTGVGGEWMIEDVRPGFALRPFGEYHLEIITSDPDPVFADYRPPLCRGSTTGAGGAPCRDNRDQQWVTLGVRGQFSSGFAFAVAFDLAAHSVGFPYGPPLPPYNFVAGISCPLDFRTPKVVTRTVPVEKKVPVKMAQEGALVGKVVSAAGGVPIEGAIVAVAGRMRARVATDPDGSFRTAAVPPGPAQLEIAAANFEPAVVQAVVVVGQESPVAVTLTPKVQKGKVTGKLTDENGRPLTGVLRFSGPQNLEVKTDDAGAFTTALTGGSYVVRVEADKHLAKEVKVAVVDGKDQELSPSVRSKPVVARATLQKGKLTVRQVSFKGPAADISPASAAVLDELADLLITHPEIKRVRIEAHWDTSVPKERAQQLTDQQARAVAAYLTAAGVGEDRLQVAGMGAEKPIFPNIGLAKLRNRRVEIRSAN